MTAIALPMTHPRTRSTLSSLAWIEAKRFARHPLFLTSLGLGLWAVIGISFGADRGPTNLDFQVVPAFLIGILNFVVAARLTRSTSRSRDVIEGAPSSDTVRTAALCLACLVPLSAGIILVVLHWRLVAGDPPAVWIYGTYGPFDRVLITCVLPSIACLGAPLLGVAVGRWLRFPGAVLLGVVVLLAGSMAASYAPMQSLDPSSLLARVLHVLSPYTAFMTENDVGPVTSVTSYTGSPGWYALWLLTLCGLAVAATLWRGAEGRTRRVVGRAFAGLSVAAVICLGAAATGGNDRPMLTTHDGVTRPATHAELQ